MLKKEMIDQLNEQLNLEFYSANLYLQMSAWCRFKGGIGSRGFSFQVSMRQSLL